MLSALRHKTSQGKVLSSNDYAWLKHQFIIFYGYDCWKEVTLREFFELLPEMMKEVAKSENFRITTLKYYGVKNPK